VNDLHPIDRASRRLSNKKGGALRAPPKEKGATEVAPKVQQCAVNVMPSYYDNQTT
jgi:hypothetical protein